MRGVTVNLQSILKSRVECLMYELVLGIREDYLSEITGRLLLCNKKASSNYLKHNSLEFLKSGPVFALSTDSRVFLFFLPQL